MLGGCEAALWASAAASSLTDCDYYFSGDGLLPKVLLPHPLFFLKAQYYRYRRLRWTETGATACCLVWLELNILWRKRGKHRWTDRIQAMDHCIDMVTWTALRQQDVFMDLLAISTSNNKMSKACADLGASVGALFKQKSRGKFHLYQQNLKRMQQRWWEGLRHIQSFSIGILPLF